MWLFWLFVCTPYQNPAAESAVPLLKLEAAWLPEPVVDPPDSVNALCWFAWPMADNPAEPFGSAAAAETALPRLVFEEAWLHEVLVVVPDKQAPACLFSWAMIDAALVPGLVDVDVCATAAFDVVVARTRRPAAIVAARIGSNFVVVILY
jgi:hypothetical protein